jgi:drug/metabolite transporter (DMT)-like permease
MLVSSVAFSLMTILMRIAAAALPVFVIAAARNAVPFLLILPLLLRPRFRLLPAARPWLAASLGVMQALSNVCWVVGLSLMPVAEVTALSFTAPLLTTAVAGAALGEVVHGRRWLATVIGFLGILVIVRPGIQAFGPAALVILLGTGMSAISSLVVRDLSRDHGTYSIVFMTLSSALPLTLVPALFVWPELGASQLLILVGIGLCGTVGQITGTRAYAEAEASVVMPFDFLRLPATALLAFALFGEIPDYWTWIGAAVIFGASIYSVRHESRLKPGRVVLPKAGRRRI